MLCQGVLVVDPTLPNVLAPSLIAHPPSQLLFSFVLVVSRRHHPIPTFSLGAERPLVGQTETSALGTVS